MARFKPGDIITGPRIASGPVSGACLYYVIYVSNKRYGVVDIRKGPYFRTDYDFGYMDNMYELVTNILRENH